MRVVPAAYLASYLLSMLGNGIAAVALPLILLQTTGSVLGAGALAASTAVPALAAGLLMGSVIDRVNRRTASVVTDLVSAAAVAALPLVDAAVGLTLGWFVLFGVLGSLGDVPGLTAREALLPGIVRHGTLTAERLTGMREAFGAVALLAGPAAAGGLMILLDGTGVLWVTAATSAAAAVVTLLIPHRVGVVEEPAGEVTRPFAGWHGLVTDRFLLVGTVLSIVMVAVIGALQGLVLPVWFLGIDRPELLGFVLTALAVGGLLGGGTYAAAGARGSRRGWLLVGTAATVLGIGLVGALPGVAGVFTGAALLGVGSGWIGSLTGVIMLERLPDHLRGRIMGTQNALLTVAAPLGIVVAAVLTHLGDARAAGLALAVVWAVAAVWAVSTRAFRDLAPAARAEAA